MLAKTVKVNIKVRGRKKVASGSIAISLPFHYFHCSAQFRTLSTFLQTELQIKYPNNKKNQRKDHREKIRNFKKCRTVGKSSIHEPCSMLS